MESCRREYVCVNMLRTVIVSMAAVYSCLRKQKGSFIVMVLMISFVWSRRSYSILTYYSVRGLVRGKKNILVQMFEDRNLILSAYKTAVMKRRSHMLKDSQMREAY